MLAGLEAAQRRLHPPQLAGLREMLAPHRDALGQAQRVFAEAQPEPQLKDFHHSFVAGSGYALEAVSLFCQAVPEQQAITNVLVSMRAFALSLENLYPLHRFPPLGRYFVEEAFRDRVEALDASPRDGVSVGLHYSGPDSSDSERGQFCLYVPESCDGEKPLPLVVALHGGAGNGRGFVWTWLREARGRGFLVLAPTARGDTWSFANPGYDGDMLRSMVSYVCERWPVKRSSVLLTGLSDGATFTLIEGLREGSPFTALAPFSGVLHPAVLGGAGAHMAAGKRIYLVHGALDWMFPVELARMAHQLLGDAGAEVIFRELADLSHTYAREENASLLPWFDSSLAAS